MAELKALSKLKMAGKLHYWRGTIEMPEAELHAICDEIQAEHDQAIAATLGKQGYCTDRDDEGTHIMCDRCGEYIGTAEEIAATLGADECAKCAEDMGAYADSLCDSIKGRLDELLRCLENDWHISASWDGLRKFWCIELTDEGVRIRDAAHGTLTAEQVREAIFSGSSYASYDGAKYYADGIGMQAIADELNAALGGGECEFVGDAGQPPKCSACGWQTSIYDCEWLEDGEYEYDGNFCKECGAKVKAVKR